MVCFVAADAVAIAIAIATVVLNPFSIESQPKSSKPYYDDVLYLYLPYMYQRAHALKSAFVSKQPV